MLNFNFLFLSLHLAIAAKTPTPTLSPTPIPTAIPTKTSIVDDFRKSVQEKVQEKIKEAKNILGKKIGWQGIVKQANLLEIEIDINGTTKKVFLGEDTTFSSGTKKLELATLKTGQTILALGYQKDDGLDAKKLFLVDTKPTSELFTTIGEIADVSKSTKTILVVPNITKGKEIQVIFDSKSIIQSSTKKNYSYTDLEKGQRIIALTYSKDKTSKLQIASKIYIFSDISQKENPTPTPRVAKPTKTQ